MSQNLLFLYFPVDSHFWGISVSLFSIAHFLLAHILLLPQLVAILLSYQDVLYDLYFWVKYSRYSCWVSLPTF